MSFSSYAPSEEFEGAVSVRILPGFKDRLQYWKIGFAAFVLPQLAALYWWIQIPSLMHFRGWFNVEYMILLAVALLIPSRVMVGLLTCEAVFSVIEPIAHLYYFTPEDAIRSLRYLAYLPPQRLAAYFFLLAVYGVGCAAFLRATLMPGRLANARTIAIGLFVASFLAIGHDVLAGRISPQWRFSMRPGNDLKTTHAFRAPVGSLMLSFFFADSNYSHSQAVPLDSALSHAMGELTQSEQPDVVLILTESWGLAFDDRINAAEIEPYRNETIGRQYRVETGNERFVGSTTAGETRELCGDSRGRTLASSSSTEYLHCWPARMKAAGYTTEAVHGFSPTMFKRQQWYEQFGFGTSTFLPDLQRKGVSLCPGAFLGACDSEVADWIGTQLTKSHGSSPAFVHWVTLNSHLPVAPVGTEMGRKKCAAVGVTTELSLCGWFNRVLDVQNSVAQLAQRPGLRPTVFVIVGDHAPPFMQASVRARFSQTNVPWVILIPRSILPRISGPRLSAANARTEVQSTQ